MVIKCSKFKSLESKMEKVSKKQIKNGNSWKFGWFKSCEKHGAPFNIFKHLFNNLIFPQVLF